MRSYDALPRDGFPSAVANQASAFLSAVYGWMWGGLTITAATAWFVAGSPTLVRVIAANGWMFWGLAIAQLGIVFVLSARVQQLAASTAGLLFIFHSAVTGVTMAFVLLAFTGESVATTFLVTAGMFAALAMYGTVTKRNLGGFGQFLFMGLLGVVLASIVGVFWHSDAFQFVLSFIGVFVFAGLAVYDAPTTEDDGTSDARRSGLVIRHRWSVGALDFANLFLFVLRFVGNRRE